MNDKPVIGFKRMADIDPWVVTWSIMMAHFADEFGLTEDDLCAVWDRGMCAVRQEHHDDPTQHPWVERTIVREGGAG